ncbi:MAG: hypothetical protein RLZZ546_3315, partial [Bacteroidota bacterium]
QPKSNIAQDIQQPVISNVNTADAKNLIANNQDLVVLDVRTPEEIANGKIDKALEININDPGFQASLEKLDKSKPVLVYCKAGGRSARACEIMSKIGFKKVYNLEQGFDGWKN